MRTTHRDPAGAGEHHPPTPPDEPDPGHHDRHHDDRHHDDRHDDDRHDSDSDRVENEPGAAVPAQRRASPGTVTDDDRRLLHAAMQALPPMSDEQIDGICDVILNARERWHRLNRQTPH
jgi:hypothetical protein